MGGILSFDLHVSQLCENASKELYALAKICKYMDIRKRRNPPPLLHLPYESFCYMAFFILSITLDVPQQKYRLQTK